jgi:hypothetical protein
MDWNERIYEYESTKTSKTSKTAQQDWQYQYSKNCASRSAAQIQRKSLNMPGKQEKYHTPRMLSAQFNGLRAARG